MIIGKGDKSYKNGSLPFRLLSNIPMAQSTNWPLLNLRVGWKIGRSHLNSFTKALNLSICCCSGRVVFLGVSFESTVTLILTTLLSAWSWATILMKCSSLKLQGPKVLFVASSVFSLSILTSTSRRLLAEDCSLIGRQNSLKCLTVLQMKLRGASIENPIYFLPQGKLLPSKRH